MPTSCNVTGLGDVVLERCLSVAFEDIDKKTGMPKNDVLGMLIAAVQASKETSNSRERMRCAMNCITRALEASGW